MRRLNIILAAAAILISGTAVSSAQSGYYFGPAYGYAYLPAYALAYAPVYAYGPPYGYGYVRYYRYSRERHNPRDTNGF